jgi:hypothetical protein
VVVERDDTTALPDLGFSVEGVPEYLVYADDEAAVPQELFQEMDRLHSYYRDNADQFIAERQRAKALQAARERTWRPTRQRSRRPL